MSFLWLINLVRVSNVSGHKSNRAVFRTEGLENQNLPKTIIKIQLRKYLTSIFQTHHHYATRNTSTIVKSANT